MIIRRIERYSLTEIKTFLQVVQQFNIITIYFHNTLSKMK